MTDHPDPSALDADVVRPRSVVPCAGDTDPAGRSRSVRWWTPTPAEVVGLAVLLLGALVATVLWWYPAVTGPGGARAGDGSSAAAVGRAVDPGGAPAERDAQATDPAGGMLTDATGSRPPDATGAPPASAREPVTVHVTGGVVTAGLRTLPADARVGDAVAAAGGLTVDADLERINLARPLTDGEHVHVPRIGEDPLPARPSAGASADAVDADGLLDLNRATAAELETLPGIGPTRAAAIVDHRERHGPFATPGDLRAVSGIGEATFQTLAPLVVTR
ncbi:MAG: helix-hairpin-helix domain-containing protein [Nitriliruptoraceae bacterium]